MATNNSDTKNWNFSPSGTFLVEWGGVSFFIFTIFCCGFLILTGAFEISLQVMLMRIADFVGLPYFLQFLEKNSEYFLKGSLKIHLTIQLLMKNHEERHPTSIFEKMWGLSFKGLNLSWTNSQCIFCMNVMATSISHINIIAFNR